MRSRAHTLNVIVDDRERRSGIAHRLDGTEGVSVSVARLSVGDYLWEDFLLFERKTLRDLVSSIKDGRLLRQACRLANLPNPAVLILEGTGPFESGMSRQAIQGALITITLRLGIPLLRSKDPRETTRLMVYAARQVRSFSARPIARPQKRRRLTDKCKVQLEILQGIPGLGPHRAERLLHQFGTVRAITSASLKELVCVPGIGARTARTIRWAVG